MRYLTFLLIVLIITHVFDALSSNKLTNELKSSFNEKEVYTALQIWRDDSCGCNGKRTDDMGNRIIKYFNLVGQPIDSITKYLGNCNRAQIFYYLKTNCNEEYEIRDSSETIVYLELRFEQDGLDAVYKVESRLPVLPY